MNKLSLSVLLFLLSLVSQSKNITFINDENRSEDKEIILTVDANGKVDEGHYLSQIKKTKFYIDDIKYKAKNGDLIVIGFNKAFFKGDALIISALKYKGRTMNVIGISKNAFKNCAVLTSVTIGNGVSRIDKNAFKNCAVLTSVTIGNGVSRIDKNAFRKCSQMTAIRIPNTVTTIGNLAFSKCKSLTSITLPNSVEHIGKMAFYGCNNLISISIGNSVKSLEKCVLAGCKSITSISLGNSVNSINARSFANISSLRDLYCFAQKAPQVTFDSFDRVPISNTTLHVPAASIEAYKAENPWKKFKNIVPIEK